MFRLVDAPIDLAALRASLIVPEAGAFVSFEGWVRNHNDGRAVLELEYEAYGPVAVTQGETILSEARARFAIAHTVCAHRVGRLAVGEMAVWVGVSAAHRGAAFDACRYIIDELKARVPIWKKEHYADGDSGWVNCEAVPR